MLCYSVGIIKKGVFLIDKAEKITKALKEKFEKEDTLSDLVYDYVNYPMTKDHWACTVKTGGWQFLPQLKRGFPCQNVVKDLAKELILVAKDVVADEPIKYPRTPHLPWSEGAAENDILLSNADMFEGMNVVVSEKMDGENTTITFDRVHARSTSSLDHSSRHWVKKLWSQMRFDIPPGMRIVGENLYAQHSIEYDKLPSFFLVFAVFEDRSCLSWSDTEEWCQLFGLKHVPVLYKGPWEKTAIMQCYTGQSKYSGLQEGYVVRNAGGFSFSQFSSNMAKFVRKSHVQTSEHWMMQKIVPNKTIIVNIPE